MEERPKRGIREMTRIIGVTYPIPKKYMNRFFINQKNVFIKPATCFKELRPEMKFVFYQSHEDTGFVGEGKIVSVLIIDDPFVIVGQFKDRLFLTKEEVEIYINNQKRWEGIRSQKNHMKKKKWMVIELKDIEKYDQIRKPDRFVTVGGRYLRE